MALDFITDLGAGGAAHGAGKKRHSRDQSGGEMTNLHLWLILLHFSKASNGRGKHSLPLIARRGEALGENRLNGGKC